MRHYLQYHNPQRYGSPQPMQSGGPFYVLTRKPAGRRVVGNILWLVIGEGRPRNYSLSKVFLVDWIRPARDPDFVYRLEGSQGVHFDPPWQLDGYPWFIDMRRHMANFSLGLTEITNTYARYLVDLARHAEINIPFL